MNPPAAAKNRVSVRIAGQNYTLSSGDPPEHLTRLVTLVNRRLGQARISAPRLNQDAALVMVLLEIGDELLKAQDDNTRLRRQLLQTHVDAAR